MDRVTYVVFRDFPKENTCISERVKQNSILFKLVFVYSKRMVDIIQRLFNNIVWESEHVPQGVSANCHNAN